MRIVAFLLDPAVVRKIRDHLAHAARPQPGSPIRGSTKCLSLVEGQRRADGRWPRQAVHRGAVHFDVDGADGEPSRWTTLRALRVLRSAGREA